MDEHKSQEMALYTDEECNSLAYAFYVDFGCNKSKAIDAVRTLIRMQKLDEGATFLEKVILCIKKLGVHPSN